MNNIMIGQSATTTIVGTVPSIIVPGNYYVFVELDTDEVLSESNENDNIARDGLKLLSILNLQLVLLRMMLILELMQRIHQQLLMI